MDPRFYGQWVMENSSTLEPVADPHCGSSRMTCQELNMALISVHFFLQYCKKAIPLCLISSGTLLPGSYMTSKTAVGIYKLVTPAVGLNSAALEMRSFL